MLTSHAQIGPDSQHLRSQVVLGERWNACCAAGMGPEDPTGPRGDDLERRLGSGVVDLQAFGDLAGGRAPRPTASDEPRRDTLRRVCASGTW
jgi:hypothetical protein